MRCRCCNRESQGSICSYCGCKNIAYLDSDSLEKDEKRIIEHRNGLLSQLSNVSFKVYQYKWNSEYNKLESKGTKNIAIGSGAYSLNDPKWSIQTLGKVTKEKGVVPIEIQYEINGAKKNFVANIQTPEPSDEFWSVGASIDESMTLRISLGNMNNSRTVTHDIEWLK